MSLLTGDLSEKHIFDTLIIIKTCQGKKQELLISNHLNRKWYQFIFTALNPVNRQLILALNYRIRIQN